MVLGPITRLQEQAKADGYTRDWQDMRAVLLHSCIETGRIIWPGQRCQYRWDGSGYDPGYEFRRIDAAID